MNASAADRWAIQDVLQTYAASVDDRDMVRYRSCFADEVEVVGFGDRPVHGGDAWRDYVADALQRFTATHHLLSPVLADVRGDRADCRTDVQAWHELQEPAGETLTLWATYLSQMQRIDGRWVIVRHELVARGTRSG